MHDFLKIIGPKRELQHADKSPATLSHGVKSRGHKTQTRGCRQIITSPNCREQRGMVAIQCGGPSSSRNAPDSYDVFEEVGGGIIDFFKLT